MKGQEGTQQPQLVLPYTLFLLTHPDIQDNEKVCIREEFFTSVKADDMALLYETLAAKSVLDMDQSILD
ncbi:hypothetical protein F0562_028071 [Nyssa sinensis]|uniref:Uncharacterized protein n=1 Tax=Nyssa sinensis TaxID=561372 RepID=A0A5J5B595_9ASTE|nr:hypothetical protein F0562_028071 [Nyssa sinensis]